MSLSISGPRSGRTVRFSVEMPEDDFRRLIAEINSRRGGELSEMLRNLHINYGPSLLPPPEEVAEPELNSDELFEEAQEYWMLLHVLEDRDLNAHETSRLSFLGEKFEELEKLLPTSKRDVEVRDSMEKDMNEALAQIQEYNNLLSCYNTLNAEQSERIVFLGERYEANMCFVHTGAIAAEASSPATASSRVTSYPRGVAV